MTDGLPEEPKPDPDWMASLIAETREAIRRAFENEPNNGEGA